MLECDRARRNEPPENPTLVEAREPQRVMVAVARAAETIAPIVQRELERAYGPDWLERVNAERVARNQSPARGLHDHRFVLALVGHDPALSQAFDDAQREAARRLNGMANAITHNEPLAADDTSRAERMAQRLLEGAPPRQSPLCQGRVRQLHLLDY